MVSPQPAAALYDNNNLIQNNSLDYCYICDNKQVLTRIPQLTNIVRKQEQAERKTGSLVKDYIQENKEILKEQKKERIDYNE